MKQLVENSLTDRKWLPPSGSLVIPCICHERAWEGKQLLSIEIRDIVKYCTHKYHCKSRWLLIVPICPIVPIWSVQALAWMGSAWSSMSGWLPFKQLYVQEHLHYLWACFKHWGPEVDVREARKDSKLASSSLIFTLEWSSCENSQPLQQTCFQLKIIAYICKIFGNTSWL